MCGIAGYFGPAEISDARVEHCLSLMRRRGPDHSASRHFRNPAGRNTYLLHSRLQIIDLDPRANQPFSIGPKWLAYNGELYNYVELRKEVEATGYEFRTNSDTEVLLAAIDRLGWSVLDRFEGMWAFAVYDEAKGDLQLSRDRFGEKPLHLYRDGDGLYFASEVKFIAALLGRPLPVDTGHLYRYLVNGYKSLYKGEQTFFEGLRELPTAATLKLDPEGRETLERYWVPSCEPEESMSYEEAVSGARDRLSRAVEIRLRADVPLAFCMSGGVDSNSLIAIARRTFDYDVHGFTIVNTDARYEEQDLVDAAVAELGIRHTSVPIDPTGFLDDLRDLVRYHDAPVYTITYFAHWRLMQQIHAEGYRISVSGTAADELFSGYYDHHLAYLYETREHPEIHSAARSAWLEHVRPIVRNPLLQNPDAFLENPGMRDHIFFDAEAFSSFLQHPWSEAFTETTFTPNLLRNRMLNELFHEATPVILHEDDLNAMYFSIENRSPYLDRQLFEFCQRIPTRHLIRDARAKSVLRDAMQGLVIDPVRTCRRKVGFNAPIFSFLDVGDAGVRQALLGPSPIWEHLKKQKIEEMLKQTHLPNSQSKFLFYFLSAKLFLEEFAA